MILKKLMPVFAIILVLAMLSPSLLAAELVENNTIIDAPSEHQDEYDEVVNIADKSSVTNPDTWSPGPIGIWAGSSTKESLFSFPDITYPGTTGTPAFHNGARMGIMWDVQFSRNQIMSGVAEFTLRLPTYNPGGALWLSYLSVYQLDDGATYKYAENSGAGSPGSKFYPAITGGSETMAVWNLNFNDTSYTDSNQIWTVDGRTYVHMIMPLFPETTYLFFLNMIYAPDTKFSLYLSPQDIASDGLMNTSVALRNYDPSYDAFRTRFETLPVDCGFSFDLQGGMGGGTYAKMFSFEAGDSLVLENHITQTGTIAGYHNLMIPFESAGIINASLAVDVFYESPYSAVTSYSISAANYKDYILACYGSTITTTRSFTAAVTVTFNTAASVMIYFRSYPGMEYNYVNVDGQEINMPVWCDYQVSATKVNPSNDVTSGVPINPLPQTLDPWKMFASVIFTLLFPGVAIAAAYYDYVTGGDSVAGWLVSKAGEYLYAGASQIYGMVKNALDAAWNFLKSIGDFINSIGEMIWDALVWLAEQIVEYGSILLGLLIIAVALMLFFYPVKWQLGFWGMVWAMAEGDWKGAAKAAQGLDKDISRAMRTAAKVDRRVARAGKVLGKKWNEFDDSVAGPENMRKPKRW